MNIAPSTPRYARATAASKARAISKHSRTQLITPLWKKEAPKAVIIRPQDTSQDCYFARLPPEIRLQVYEYILPTETLALCSMLRHKLLPALLGVCRLIRREAAAMFYGSTHFTGGSELFQIEFLERWLTAIPTEHRVFLAKNRKLTIVIRGPLPNPTPSKQHELYKRYGNRYLVPKADLYPKFINFCQLARWAEWCGERSYAKNLSWNYEFEIEDGITFWVYRWPKDLRGMAMLREWFDFNFWGVASARLEIDRVRDMRRNSMKRELLKVLRSMDGAWNKFLMERPTVRHLILPTGQSYPSWLETWQTRVVVGLSSLEQGEKLPLVISALAGHLKQRLPGHTNGESNADHNRGTSDDTNKAEQGKPHEEPTPTPVGFWDPSLRHVKNRAFGKWVVTIAFLMAFILAILSIYWGVFFQVEQRLNHLLVYVVDFDGQTPYSTNSPLVGPTITRMTQQMLNSEETTLGFSIRSPAEFKNDSVQVRQSIYNFDAWAAIIINPNATDLLYSAIATGNASYDPLGACQLIYQDSRDDTNWYDFMLPLLSTYMTQAQSMAAPQAVNPAIGFSEFNLRPFFPYTGIPAVSIGLIYLIIISFFSFSFYLPIHMQYINLKAHPPLKFYQLIIWRWCATMSAYIFLSLAYSFVSIAFQINFTHSNPIQSETQVTEVAYGNPVAYSNGTFPIYWMLNFFGMVALGLACENVAMVVGAPWMGLWLIFWVITNVSTSFYDIEIAPGFYRWGYTWPLHSVVEGSRQILFDLHPRIGLDFGILLAWGAVNTAFFPICCWFQRWKTKRGVHEYWPME
ncbi:hypothetical protein BU23DRAFT_569400 [Bimuria novae-zelandiae CBS 107.79]|uniref:DUF3533 domain-containing protein n=1 Tax=Bimuria novae-zelandiae CBS 107.79 TaxID=1447943 RepID=A0A6A5VFY7_9PLEO|nr:hypothetical protein BU23DRAFT_569400 [Bimuria novae-zelandiae CBS 107.79]